MPIRVPAPCLCRFYWPLLSADFLEFALFSRVSAAGKRSARAPEHDDARSARAILSRSLRLRISRRGARVARRRAIGFREPAAVSRLPARTKFYGGAAPGENVVPESRRIRVRNSR